MQILARRRANSVGRRRIWRFWWYPWVGLLRRGERYREGTAPTWNTVAFEPDLSPVHLHKLLGDREAKARARRFQNERILSAEEALKYPCLIGPTDAHAVVHNIQLHIMPTCQ